MRLQGTCRLVAILRGIVILQLLKSHVSEVAMDHRKSKTPLVKALPWMI